MYTEIITKNPSFMINIHSLLRNIFAAFRRLLITASSEESSESSDPSSSSLSAIFARAVDANFNSFAPTIFTA